MLAAFKRVNKVSLLANGDMAYKIIEENVNPLHTRPRLSLSAKAMHCGSDDSETDEIVGRAESNNWKLRRGA